MSSSPSHCPVSGFSESSAPLRVDLAGGWTDVPPYPTDFGGEVVNFAINHRVRVKKREELKDSDLEFDFPVPRGSGLGNQFSDECCTGSAKFVQPIREPR